jgi:hypothetical protein
VHCPYQGIPRSIRWASTISRSPTESHLIRSCGSALCGIRIRNDGRDTRRALLPGQISPGLRLHVASNAECSLRCHGAASQFLPLEPWALEARGGGHSFSLVEPDLRLASRRILYPYQCGVAGSFSLSISHASGAWQAK